MPNPSTPKGVCPTCQSPDPAKRLSADHDAFGWPNCPHPFHSEPVPPTEQGERCGAIAPDRFGPLRDRRCDRSLDHEGPHQGYEWRETPRPHWYRIHWREPATEQGHEEGHRITTHTEDCAAALIPGKECDCPSVDYVPASALTSARTALERINRHFSATGLYLPGKHPIADDIDFARSVLKELG